MVGTKVGGLHWRGALRGESCNECYVPPPPPSVEGGSGLDWQRCGSDVVAMRQRCGSDVVAPPPFPAAGRGSAVDGSSVLPLMRLTAASTASNLCQ